MDSRRYRWHVLLQTNLGFVFRDETVGAFLVGKGTLGSIGGGARTQEAHRSASRDTADGQPPIKDAGGRRTLLGRTAAGPASTDAQDAAPVPSVLGGGLA